MRLIVSTIVLGMTLLTGSTATATADGSVSNEQGNESAVPVIHVPCIGCW